MLDVRRLMPTPTSRTAPCTAVLARPRGLALLAAVALAALAAGCGGGSSADAEPAPVATNGTAGDERPAQQGSPRAYFERGVALAQAGRCEDAIRSGFEPAMRGYERSHGARGGRVIASRAGGGAALLGAAAEAGSAVVVDTEWPDAIYMTAFCLIELRRVEEAERLLGRALDMIPGDLVYSCELGYVRQQQRRWDESLALYQAALENVAMLERTGAFGPTPEHPRGQPIFGMTTTDWMRRAMRGIGFTQIELGQLDAAEETFRRVLAIDPSDARALQELQYIEEQRAGRAR